MIIAILGVGAMGEAILAGLCQDRQTGAGIRVADARADRAHEIAQKYGVTATTTEEAVQGAEAVVAAVKPHDVAGLLDHIQDSLRPGALVVSVAAGVGLAGLEAHLPTGQPVVRVMPNTAAMVGEGMTAIAPGSSAGQADLERARVIMSAVGRVVTVKESQMDAVTALSGSGPAYVMYIAEAMIDAGVLLGLPRDTATELVAQTLYGSSRLLVTTGQHPTMLKEQVTSPGGTTIAALRVFDEHAVKAAFIDAVTAAYRRSQELGAQGDR